MLVLAHLFGRKHLPATIVKAKQRFSHSEVRSQHYLPWIGGSGLFFSTSFLSLGVQSDLQNFGVADSEFDMGEFLVSNTQN